MKTTITRNFIKAVAVCSLIAIPVLAQAQSFSIWMALRVGQQMHTSYDVREYIKTTKISEETHRALFRMAQGDWQRYQELKSQLVDDYFEEAIKEKAYNLMVEHLATRNLRRGESRQAFAVTTEDYNRAIQEREREVLGEWLDQRLGIVVARREYGKQLRTTGYPHQEHETDEEIFWRWYEVQRKLIKEAFRKREVARYEQVRAQLLNTYQPYRPLAISDLYRELEGVINQELQGRRLTAREVAEIQNENPLISMLITNMQLLSLSGSPLARINSIEGRGESKFRESMDLVRTQLNPALGSERIERIMHYEQMAQSLAQRHNDPQVLETLSRQRTESFVSGGSHNDFMMARLYDLAKRQLEQQPERAAIRARVQQRLESGLEWLKAQHQTGNIYLQENVSALLFEDALARILRQEMRVDDVTDSYERAFLDMAIWVVKFEAKRVSLQDQAIVNVDIAPFSGREVYQRLDQHFLMLQYRNGLERFHREDLRRNSYILEITPEIGRSLRSESAIDFILN